MSAHPIEAAATSNFPRPGVRHLKAYLEPILLVVWVVGWSSALVLGVAVSFYFPSPLSATAYAGDVAVSVVGIVLFARRFNPVLLTVSIFHAVWILLPAAVQVLSSTGAWGDSYFLTRVSAIEGALLLDSLFWLCFIAIGQFSWRSKGATISKRDPVARHAPRGEGTRVAVAGGVLAGAAALLPLVVSQLGGFAALFAFRGQVGDLLAEAGLTTQIAGGGAVALIRILPASLSAVGCLLSLESLLASGRRKSRIAVLFFCAGLGLLTIYANPLANTRFLFLAAFGPIVLLALRGRTGFAAKVYTLALFAALLVAYPLANFFRAGASAASSPQAILAGSDFDGFQQMVNAVQYVSANGVAWGNYILSALLFFIPRSLWASKATPSSIDVAGWSNYSFTNLSMPGPFELYLDGGIPLLVVGAVALGWAAGRLDRLWHVTFGGSALSAFVSCAAVGLYRGPAGAQVPVVGVTFALLLFWTLLSRHSRRRVSSA